MNRPPFEIHTAGPTADSSPTSADSAEACLVAGLLRAVERSVSYRQPEAWHKPAIVRWATAWSTDSNAESADRLRARLRAARWLVSIGGGTVTYDKPPYEDRPRTIRCTAAQCATLEALARDFGITPLRDALSSLRDAWAARRTSLADELPAWWIAYEARIDAALATPAPLGIGVSADRLVEIWPEWLESVTAARGIAGGMSGYERVVSERLLGHSKRLAELRRAVAGHLVAADPRWSGDAGSATQILAAYGVRRIAPGLDVAGPIVVDADGSSVDVSRIEGLARLPGSWARALANAASAADIRLVTTIENETTAWGYLEERGGPAGLADARELVLYTAGFAATAGADALAQLWAELPFATFRHWGDADGPGLHVWLDLARRSGAPIRWWRTTAAWIEAAAERRAGAPLSIVERRGLEQLVSDLRTNDALDPGGEALGCAEALLRAGVKIEQEAFEPALDAR